MTQSGGMRKGIEMENREDCAEMNEEERRSHGDE